MTAYEKPSKEKTTNEETIRRQLQEKKQYRAKQLADVKAGCKQICRPFQRKHGLQAAIDTIEETSNVSHQESCNQKVLA